MSKKRVSQRSTTSPRVRALAAVTLKLLPYFRDVLRIKELFHSAFAIPDLYREFAACWWSFKLPPLPPDASDDAHRKRSEMLTEKENYQIIVAGRMDPPAVANLIRLLHKVFEHLGWGHDGILPNGETKFEKPWRWPDVPIIPDALIVDLEQTAQSLLPLPVNDNELKNKLKEKRPHWRNIDRDLFFFKLSKEQHLGPAEIRDRCRQEHPEWRLAGGNSGREVVKAALKETEKRMKKSRFSR